MHVGTLTNCPTTWYNPSKTWYTPTPRALLSWQATRDVLTYVSYTRGWAAGNFNGSPSSVGAAITPANPETVDSYEFGVKSEWFDHRFRANVAVYDEKFKNIQRTVTTAVEGIHVQSLLNAAQATIKGAEAGIDGPALRGGENIRHRWVHQRRVQQLQSRRPLTILTIRARASTELGFANTAALDDGRRWLL